MQIYLENSKYYDARRSIKEGTVKYQKENFNLCTGLKHWCRYGKYIFRYNEVLWFLGGKYIDWTDDDFELNKITAQIIRLSKNDKFENVLKNTQKALRNDRGESFQKWLIDSYS